MSTINAFAGALYGRWIALRDSEKGQGLVEYALVVALIAVVSILVLQALGIDVFGALDTTQKNMPAGSTPSTPST